MRKSVVLAAGIVSATVVVLGPAAAPAAVSGLAIGDLTPAVMAAAFASSAAANGSEPNVRATGGVTSAAVPATTAGTSYKTISGTVFTTRATADTYTSALGGGFQSLTISGAPYHLARLDLPQGAKITEVVAYFADNDGAAAGALWLSRYTSSDAVTWDMASVASVGAALGVRSYTINLSAAPITVNNASDSYTLLAATNSATSSVIFYGARVGYIAPAAAFVPITPARVFDSRLPGFGGGLSAGTSRTFDVKSSINPTTGAIVTTNVIPPGAIAVTYNLTITRTTGSGYLSLAPGTSSAVTASAINWSTTGTTVANGGVIALGSGAAERQITVSGHIGKTHVIIDVTGYYILP